MEEVDCQNCNGIGKIYAEHDCSECAGTGKVPIKPRQKMREIIPTFEDIQGMTREEVYKAIEDASMELFRSDRGTTVRKQLCNLLEGPISQLDENHWLSVFILIQFYRADWTGAVLEELRYGKRGVAGFVKKSRL